MLERGKTSFRATCNRIVYFRFSFCLALLFLISRGLATMIFMSMDFICGL